MKQPRKRSITKLFLIILLLVTFITVLWLIWGKTFIYSNLIDSAEQEIMEDLLIDANIPAENIDRYMEKIERFYSIPYKGIVQSGWKRSSIVLFSYRDNSAIEHFDEQPDFSLSCRAAAFILLKDNITWGEVNLPAITKKDEISRTHISDNQEDLLHFDLLFSNIDGIPISSSEQLVETLTQYWHNSQIDFGEGNVHLVTAYASEGTKIENWHTAISIFADGKVWLLEKYNPIYPFQLSCFDGEEDMVAYMKKRLSGAKYAAVLSDTHYLWMK